MTPAEHAGSYLGLLEQFESWFQVPVLAVGHLAV
jgi:hypothetical protein